MFTSLLVVRDLFSFLLIAPLWCYFHVEALRAILRGDVTRHMEMNLRGITLAMAILLMRPIVVILVFSELEPDVGTALKTVLWLSWLVSGLGSPTSQKGMTTPGPILAYRDNCSHCLIGIAGLPSLVRWILMRVCCRWCLWGRRPISTGRGWPYQRQGSRLQATCR